MINKKTVDFIVDWFFLKPEVARRVSEITLFKFKNSEKTAFDRLYKYIDYLVSRFDPYYRSVISMDAHLSNDSPETLHDRIFLEEPEKEKHIFLSDLISSLKTELKEEHLRTLERLQKSDRQYIVTGIADLHKSTIESRLEEVKLYLDEKQISYRPIKAISFQPLKFKLGHRRFNRNPLGWILDNRPELLNYRRGRLASLDSSLHKKLIAVGQIDAIPANEKNVAAGKKAYSICNSPEKIEEITKAHEDHSKNAKDAAKDLDIGHCTVLKYWKKKGLHIRKSRLLADDIGAIVESHATFKGSAVEASKNLPYSINSIRKYWKINNLKVSRRGKSEILSTYEEYDGNLREVNRVLPYSKNKIRRTWKENGLYPKGKSRGRSLKVEEREEIVKAYGNYEGNISKAAKELKRAFVTVKKVWTLEEFLLE